jgi:hypothetical protein
LRDEKGGDILRPRGAGIMRKAITKTEDGHIEIRASPSMVITTVVLLCLVLALAAAIILATIIRSLEERKNLFPADFAMALILPFSMAAFLVHRLDRYRVRRKLVGRSGDSIWMETFSGKHACERIEIEASGISHIASGDEGASTREFFFAYELLPRHRSVVMVGSPRSLEIVGVTNFTGKEVQSLSELLNELRSDPTTRGSEE